MQAPKKPIYYTRRFTGWQCVFGLRTDLYSHGDSLQYELGCLDAPTSMPAGSIIGVEDTSRDRWAKESNWYRGE